MYRDPDRAYRLEAEERSTKIDAAVKGMEQAALSAGVDIQTHIKGLYIQLDQANRSMQAQLAAAYKTYAQSPCDQFEWMRERVDRILDHESELRRMLIEIYGIQTMLAGGARGKHVEAAISRALDRMLLPEAARQAIDALATVPALTAAWQEPIP